MAGSAARSLSIGVVLLLFFGLFLVFYLPFTLSGGTNTGPASVPTLQSLSSSFSKREPVKTSPEKMNPAPEDCPKLASLLQQIQSGEIVTKVDLSNCGLYQIPEEILKNANVCDNLEFLNLGGNHVSELPEGFEKLHKLRILFFAGNKFESIPAQLGNMSALFMLSFKGNAVKTVPADSLSPSISWLILTDNQITELPDSIGRLSTLRKLMLSGNLLKKLPESLQNCRELELLRLCQNQLTKLPHWLLSLPKLSWLAFNGNPIVRVTVDNVSVESSSSSTAALLPRPSVPPTDANADINEESTAASREQQDTAAAPIEWSRISLGEKVGEGASGLVYKAVLHPDPQPDPDPGLSAAAGSSADKAQEVAVKIFRGTMTSDGSPEQEMLATAAVGQHPHFIPTLGRLINTPNNELGLVFPLIPPSEYQILGNPPSFDTITRDTFPEDTVFSLAFVLQVLEGIASACAHLHTQAGLAHGDVYAHNILVRSSSLHPASAVDSRGEENGGEAGALLTDFGAASFLWPPGEAMPTATAAAAAVGERGAREWEGFTGAEVQLLERIEVRAFGCLIEDMLTHLSPTTLIEREGSKNTAGEVVNMLMDLQHRCIGEVVSERPDFAQVFEAAAKAKSTFIIP